MCKKFFLYKIKKKIDVPIHEDIVVAIGIIVKPILRKKSTLIKIFNTTITKTVEAVTNINCAIPDNLEILTELFCNLFCIFNNLKVS